MGRRPLDLTASLRPTKPDLIDTTENNLCDK